jgi:hypothetical protein
VEIWFEPATFCVARAEQAFPASGDVGEGGCEVHAEPDHLHQERRASGDILRRRKALGSPGINTPIRRSDSHTSVSLP